MHSAHFAWVGTPDCHSLKQSAGEEAGGESPRAEQEREEEGWNDDAERLRERAVRRRQGEGGREHCNPRCKPLLTSSKLQRELEGRGVQEEGRGERGKGEAVDHEQRGH